MSEGEDQRAAEAPRLFDHIDHFHIEVWVTGHVGAGCSTTSTTSGSKSAHAAWRSGDGADSTWKCSTTSAKRPQTPAVRRLSAESVRQYRPRATEAYDMERSEKGDQR
jgi:hypothetical protein